MTNRNISAVTDAEAVQISTPAAVERWAEAKADEVLDVLADVGRNPGALSEEVERKLTELHAVAADLRDAAHAERGRETNF